MNQEPSASRTGDLGTDFLARFGPRALTPGQRFTTGLLLMLTSAVLLFGLPEDLPGPVASPFGSAPVSSPTADAAQPTAPGEVAPPLLPSVVSPPAPATGAAVAVESSPTNAPTAPALSVLAVVRPGDGLPTGRSDADIARFFLTRTGLDVEYVELTAEGDQCADLANAGSMLVMSDGLPGPLRNCALEAGTVMLAHDARGSTRVGSGVVLSTRRGLTDNLLDLAASADGERLRGTIGIAASSDLEDDVRTVIPRLSSMGVDIAATSFVEPGPGASAAIAAGVLEQVQAGVETVVLALPVAQQSDWVAKHRGIRPGLRLVVADAHDAVINEAYLPAADGAFALTAYRTPWFERNHGETEEQVACREAWETSVRPNRILSRGELIRVLIWCQHASMLSVAATSSGDQVATLRAGRFASPLTSTIGPLGQDLIGPLEDAALVWRADCGCWTVSREFAPRREGR